MTETTILFFVQSDAINENSNGVAKIIINLIKRLKNYKFKFIIVGKPVASSIYCRYGNTAYLNKKSNFFSYLKIKYLFMSSADEVLIESMTDKQDIVLVFGSFINLNLLSKFNDHRVRLCLVDSGARYYFKLKTSNIIKWVFAKIFMVNLELFYELVLRLKGHKICYVSEKDKNFLKILSNKCHVIGNGVSVEDKQQEHVPMEVKRVVFVGNLDYAPNRHAVNFIAKKLCERLPEFIFYAVGNGHEKLATIYRQIPNLVFTGYIEDLKCYLNINSIFISPIFSGTGLQNKVLDAFACGVAVIASKESVAGINCIPNVHYLPANTGDQFVHLIQQLSVSQKTREALTKCSSDLVKRDYSWESISQKFQEFILNE